MRQGLTVTVVDRSEEPMTTLDPDMGRLVHKAMEDMGIDVRTKSAVERFAVTDGRVRGVVVDGETIQADIVVLGIGVRPNTALAAAAGLPLGSSGGLRVDRRLGVVGHEGIWSGGDCVETFNRVSQQWGHVALGTHANKHGRVIGENIAGGYATFPGIVGTAISKVCELEIARTGLRESEATAAGFGFTSVTIDATTTAGYLAAARPMTVKMLAEVRSGRLLGAQIVGREGARQAHRCLRRRAVERDDRRGDGRAGSRLRAAVLTGVGSRARGCSCGGVETRGVLSAFLAEQDIRPPIALLGAPRGSAKMTTAETTVDVPPLLLGSNHADRHA